ncbi:dihydroorotase [Ethanoligenens harbinense]|uniref:Dihydroorotase n=1 Tax=Ethanoligenens harbinense (strain DSM 18485 / JCM 12961 / CGMCC 1.5033 / YUAN-3) TaxID=663278 RepID=E6U5D8_ETHHY|nr:dihydroorotase [Ethanoligenens harbinense]ADU25605.1 dihydroorotase, multifunctional complex type [Ethanoligenens harbinense YUAN-3]AVQ94782.1 dihydroorotase [Ethanoligenens harbinense YUAN-3]AYF37474.1 dihydroorotase [Ethanoligenens harbinense]AYF40193.1 dihydroorotase [Ethanoligenens harbinense]QCN91029.1 dihydroorotase [Ethanoligenens harbinense]
MNGLLLIKGATLVDPEEVYAGVGDLLVKDGKIAAVAESGGNLAAPAGTTVLDARGLYLSPGLVDMHVHLRDPGQTHKETIETGCAAAAAGGVTALAAMPNTSPAADTPAVLVYEAAQAEPTGVRVFPIAAVSKAQAGDELTDFEMLSEAGAVAFSDDGHPVRDAAQMLEAMRRAHALGKRVISHCEDESLADAGIVSDTAAKRLDVPGIPAATEAVHAAREAVLAESTGTPVHIAHVSSRFTVALLRDAKRRGAPVTCETCPHYFSLDDSLLDARDADYRMNPPLREKADVAAVIKGLRDGTIDAIVTDHAPHTAGEKADFTAAPNGVVGLETSLAAGITYLVRPGHLSLPQLIRKMTTVPADLLGIRAGRLKIGTRADMVLFDPAAPWTVRPEALHSKSHNTPYKGMTLYGEVRYTISDGCIIFSKT